MKVLGIETSADDTGIAIIDASGQFGPRFNFKILANVVSSQPIHAAYGGIYPNLAKREHARNLPIALEQALQTAAIGFTKPNIDAIAVTVGPGLEPCLWTGITFAKELAAKWNVPVVPVNHMEGHILISMMQFEPQQHPHILKYVRVSGILSPATFPMLALLISGGHTELILMKKFGEYEYLGRTRDDAVGEAFDKVARMLDLPYPGGPEISRLAESARVQKLPSDVTLPRPMMHNDSYDFSFSGLKTAVERHVQTHPLRSHDKEKLAREFEDAVADVLAYKTFRAAEEYGTRTLIVGGGVSANKHIRKKFAFWAKETGSTMLVCPTHLSTDNGLMIALSGYFRAKKKLFEKPENLSANGTMKLC